MIFDLQLSFIVINYYYEASGDEKRSSLSSDKNERAHIRSQMRAQKRADNSEVR